jgi:hypothetical protein
MTTLRITAVLAAFAAFFVSGVSPAHAGFVHPRVPITEMSLQRQSTYWKWSVSHYRYVCEHGTGKVRAGHCAALRWSLPKLRAVVRQLHPVRPAMPSALPPHESLWLCIHGGEGAWNANTGNGYYGGLQMTYGWLGLIPGRASDLSPLQQMWAAETGYRQAGFSQSWLFGQWPNTSPPCV